MKSGQRRNFGKARGFSMIEVLVALLVLLIGLLGVVRMQLFSVQNNQGAYLRTQATYIASELMDRIRTNKRGQDLDGYITHDWSGAVPSDSAGTCRDAISGCSAAQLVNIDIREISSHFENVYGVKNYQVTLPSGRVAVARTDVSAGIVEYQVTVFWGQQDWQGSGGEAIRASDVENSVELRSVIRDK